MSHNGTGAQLYNIAKDPGETRDLAAQHPVEVKSLTEKAQAWVKTLPPSPARDQAAATGKPADSRPKPDPGKTAKPPSNTPADRGQVFVRWDADHDGFLSLAEFQTGLKNHPESAGRFRARDKNGDNKLNRDEFVHPIGR